MAMARVKPTLEAIRVRATRLHVGFSQTWSIRARIVHTQLSFSLVSPVRSFRSPLFLREKKMRITNAVLEIGNGTGMAINFPEIYFKFFSNYLFISIPFFSFACIRTNTHEWNFFNRSLVGKLTEVIDEMGNIFAKITRVHESVIDTRERSNIGVLKVSGIERCDLYTWNKNP